MVSQSDVHPRWRSDCEQDLYDPSGRKKGVAYLRYEKLNMQGIKTRIHKGAGFSTYFFHTLIKQRRKKHTSTTFRKQGFIARRFVILNR
jgi:hypothetical protein